MRLDATVSDQCLVEQVRAGSERAFEALFDRHHPSVLAFCRRILRSPADADDAAQHTFVAAYYDLTRSERPIALRPWLYGIARHRCLNVLRDHRRQLDREAPAAVTDRRAVEVVVAREDLRAVLSDICDLPDDQRAALVLAELGDRSHEEIAQVIGCRREKVKALLFQARASLIAERAARETACAEVRAQLTTLRGAALRRGLLRRHLRECPGCQAFRDDLPGPRHRLLLLPLTALAGVRRVIAGALVGSGPGAEGVSIAAGALNAGALAATALTALTIAGGGSSVHAPPPPPAPRTLAVERAPRDTAGAHAPRSVAPAGHRTRMRAKRDEQHAGPLARHHARGEHRPATPPPNGAAPQRTAAADAPPSSAAQSPRDDAEPTSPTATGAQTSGDVVPPPARKREPASPPKERHPARPIAPPGQTKPPPAAGPASAPARPQQAGPGDAAAPNAAAQAHAPDAAPPAQAAGANAAGGAQRARPTS